MTSGGLAAPRLEDGSPRPRDPARVVTCAFCRRRLADEYYFTCLKCEASFCYIHMSRHQPAPCARLTGRRRRAHAAAAGAGPEGVVPGQGGRQLLLAGPSAGLPPSANV